MQKQYKVNEGEVVSFQNQVDYCIGTGRMGLALQQEYLKQLELVQTEIGFKHIRGHGLFCDDMAIYQEYEDGQGNKKVEYNFTYLDLVMDSYQRLGLKPFLELGFMPQKLASGTQTIFYWKGNTTPPADESRWCALVQATLRHLMDRYGKEEVVTWPVEVWNEPNLPGFWEHADQKKYFRLFEITFAAIKEVDERFLVGGPAVCGGSDEVWIRAFLEFCQEKKIPVDFVTRHHYTTDFPKTEGHYGYVNLTEPEEGFANLKTTRNIIDSFPEYKGLKIHITEFNTSYIPNAPLHDTNLNAAYIALQLSRLGDGNESYSYWTFGDIFEEQGVPFTPFHGGFGLVANGGIPKPTFWTFQFFKQLTGTCVHRSNEAVITKEADHSYRGVVWNLCGSEAEEETLEISFNMSISQKLSEGQKKTELEDGYVLITKTVDEEVCNPLKVWHDIGEPASLTKPQLELLKQSARPLIATKRFDSENMNVRLSLKKNAVVYFEVKPADIVSDRGYSYEKVFCAAKS